MKPFFPALAALLLSLPAQADEIFCELPWFARNLIFDRAGYCFASPLGRATFDNADCTGTDIALSERDRAAVAHIEELERELGCAVDSSAPSLDFEAHFTRLRALDVIPAPVEDESGCIGYAGDPLPLRAAPDPEARIIGQIRPGDDLLFYFLNEGAWDYVVIFDEADTEATRPHGWAPVALGHIACEMYAG
jgi:hypothetical protein